MIKMTIRPKLLFLILVFSISLQAAVPGDTTFIESKITLHTATGDIFGTLTFPTNYRKAPVTLIIAGSGPTDRNGNSVYIKTDALKKLAHHLAQNGIASLRYDKRAIGESAAAAKSEADLRFDDYVNDAREWIQLLRKDKKFTRIIVIGHSEGSLIGMVAAQQADKFISIAGAGRPADLILKEQLGNQTQQIKDISYPIIDSLKSGKTVKEVNPMLFSLFRPSVQPYMLSWFKYNPQEEIKKLKIPVLIIQGTSDIQVTEEDAKLLSASNPKTNLVIIDKMNHIFRIIEGDKQVNMASYNNPELPVSEEMISKICKFIKK